MASIKIAGVVNDSIVDGEGFRFAIFTQGCYHNCPQCHNPQTHDINGGHEADTDELFRQICENPLLSGVTFSGGEPFLQPKPLSELAQKVHERGLNITTFTGYTLEQLWQMHDEDVDALLNQTDVLIDGPFVAAKKDISLRFRGSSNQRIIDMNETRRTGKIVLIKDED
ncbi:anaerobic ribonucleoside-triphosphate reductase activating protein [Megamonas hypermegale]|uniref:anaerobic ribonucleoside-triphosphate reductase activating protein n=1 Tax=Megamonas hypermegale TaxID=158847 RepID=UPI0026F1A172|nr:anaerobic ribonucleoside-triphosphate reductase activating protein [Megamonas hypermegale]